VCAGEVSQSVAGKLLQLCQALDGGDFVTATHLQARLVLPRALLPRALHPAQAV
jgi:hypothetical protein